MLSVHTFCTATSIPGFLQPRASRTSLCCWRARAAWMLCLWGGATSPKPIAGWPSSDVVSEFSTSTRRGLAFWLQVTAGYCRLLQVCNIWTPHGHLRRICGDVKGYSLCRCCPLTWWFHLVTSLQAWSYNLLYFQSRLEYYWNYIWIGLYRARLYRLD